MIIWLLTWLTANTSVLSELAQATSVTQSLYLGYGWSSDLNLVLIEKNLGSPFIGSIKIYLATL